MARIFAHDGAATNTHAPAGLQLRLRAGHRSKGQSCCQAELVTNPDSTGLILVCLQRQPPSEDTWGLDLQVLLEAHHDKGEQAAALSLGGLRQGGHLKALVDSPAQLLGILQGLQEVGILLHPRHAKGVGDGAHLQASAIKGGVSDMVTLCLQAGVL